MKLKIENEAFFLNLVDVDFAIQKIRVLSRVKSKKLPAANNLDKVLISFFCNLFISSF